MSDKSALLDSLKIERTPVRRGTSPWIWAVLAVLLLARCRGRLVFLA